jgi:hypothetical protein
MELCGDRRSGRDRVLDGAWQSSSTTHGLIPFGFNGLTADVEVCGLAGIGHASSPFLPVSSRGRSTAAS